MTFSDLVTAEFNSTHRERVREGKKARPEDMGDWLLSFCRVMDKYRVYAPGVSRHYEPEELEHDDLADVGIAP
jgi:hypothetical protein